MRKLSLIYILAMLLIAAASLSGCMVSADEAILKSSEKTKMPDISGAFKNEKQETFLLTKVDGANNTFTLTAPDENRMTLIFEPLKAEGRYIFQLQNTASPDVLLGICEIADSSLKIYRLVPSEAAALAKKQKIIIDENGRLPKKITVGKLKTFLEDCFEPPNSALVTTIKPGSSPSQSKKK